MTITLTALSDESVSSGRRDFDNRATTITFRRGSGNGATKSVHIPVFDDATDEVVEGLIIVLEVDESRNENHQVKLTPNLRTAIGKIYDDDRKCCNNV